ncbi:MAG: DUF3883 domain-containing protein [Candidatus Cloacimonetes bacterium]|nr:DUF3883 domain-containing protein [Candidatus Cloacimonadota bacterium]
MSKVDAIAANAKKWQKDKAEEWAESEALRKSFVETFPLEQIKELSIDEYIIGKNNHNSFCYKLEYETNRLGSMQGGRAPKFGVYCRKADGKFIFARRWGANLTDVFVAVKDEIYDLLIASRDKNDEAIRANRLAPTFKHKLLFLYYPDQYINLFSENYLKCYSFFLDIELNITKGTLFLLQREINNFYQELIEDNGLDISIYAFTRSIIDLSKLHNRKAPILSKDLPELGATFLDSPPIPTQMNRYSRSKGKRDWQKHNLRLQEIGKLGEDIVVRKEAIRLKKIGCTDVDQRIDHVSEREDHLGYDIKITEHDGTTKYIEVKTTTSSDFRNGFYITANELAKSIELGDQYWFYFVFRVFNAPKIWRCRSCNFGNHFCKQTVNYHINYKTKEV